VPLLFCFPCFFHFSFFLTSDQVYCVLVPCRDLKKGKKKKKGKRKKK
jgi:hypothetical protein